MTPHLTPEQLDALLAPAATVPSNAVILAQPESPYLPLPSSATATETDARAHLLACPQCAAELARLRDSLTLFRDATTAHADQLLRRIPRVTLPSRSYRPALESAYWVTAAAMGLAVLLPIKALRQPSLQQPLASTAGIAQADAQSDEALLDDVNRDISASVPASMQALDDPTGASPISAQASSAASDETPAQTPDQRKD
jgi:hypothetical protein